MEIKNMGALVLAAGKGTRMHSDRPKVLQKLLDEPMLAYVLNSLEMAGFKENIWIICGHRSDLLKGAFPQYEHILQTPQLGTGHALMCAAEDPEVIKKEYLLVINGDSPLITSDTLIKLMDQSAEYDLSFLTITPANINQYGRVIRREGTPAAIVEAKDFDPESFPEYSGEVNVGIYIFKANSILPLLKKINNDNKGGEYYLTDLVRLAYEEKLKVCGICCGDDENLLGINTPAELATAEEILRARIVGKMLKEGVIFHAPQLVRCGPFVHIEPGAEISGPCELYGKTHIESGAVIQSHCVIINCLVNRDSQVNSFCHLENAVLGEETRIGPYSRLRPGAVAQTRSHIGNFVELKKTVLGEGAKANHLSYLGDSHIGANANIGAGTITCNYDGKNKFPTIIGEGAFIGSNSALVAPVKIGNEALVGAGSVITTDVPDGDLAIARARQKNLKKRPK